ncbi:MAG: tRNA (adenosine(37)-N6)-threonylcarbamoyltransferase complex dimerization subunit type 1 TsaB [Oculatellaceae cyanobacterium Prado106]|jgi:tRNA threonylcarbamoyl adenosine modification protein YeaZ|nr:tRNA (adenosine(37)-N6)-threonylcarbamoyltransferase complex dimerization subunit type 1 TsaB [Oculatellaceae cyanobacterium Prado106]
MYALAIHTASPDLGLAISNFAGDDRRLTQNLGQSLSSQIHPLLIEFLLPQSWADLTFLAVAKGPGSFTGTRMGVVTARTLAQQLEIPLFGISTLAAAVWAARETGDRHQDWAVSFPAQRGAVHAAIYRMSEAADKPALMAKLPDTVMDQAEWQQTLATWETPYQTIAAPPNMGDTTASLLELAYGQWLAGDRPHWSDILPFYGQSPV